MIKIAELFESEFEELKYKNFIDIQIQQLIENKQWITQNQERIYIKNMSTKHIENCIKMLDRNNNPYRNLFIPMFKEELNQRLCQF